MTNDLVTQLVQYVLHEMAKGASLVAIEPIVEMACDNPWDVNRVMSRAKEAWADGIYTYEDPMLEPVAAHDQRAKRDHDNAFLRLEKRIRKQEREERFFRNLMRNEWGPTGAYRGPSPVKAVAR